MRLGTGTCTGTGTGTCTDLDTGTGTGTCTGTVRATSMHMHEHACMRSHGTRVRAHVCGQRAVHPHHTHTHTHVHTAGCPRACACTGASSPPPHRADTPTDQGHSTRSLVCCTACTSASAPACPAKNFAPLGPRAAFLLTDSGHETPTDLFQFTGDRWRGPVWPLGPCAALRVVCLIVTLNAPHRPFSVYWRPLAGPRLASGTTRSSPV